MTWCATCGKDAPTTRDKPDCETCTEWWTNNLPPVPDHMDDPCPYSKDVAPESAKPFYDPVKNNY